MHSLISLVSGSHFVFGGRGGAVEGQEGELQWVDPSAFAEHIKLTTTIPLIS